MGKLGILASAILVFFLLLFGIVVASGVPLETMTTSWVEQRGIAGMAISVVLLVSDVFLPVPSSIIMILNGTLYGPWLGTLLSLAGGTGAACVGYLLGRSGESTVLKWLSPSDIEKANNFYKKWGALAVIVSRPVPLISETVAVMAGLSGWGMGKTVASAFAGLLPVAIVYALSGYYVTQSDYGTITFLLVIAIGAFVWWVGKIIQKRKLASLNR